MNISKEDKDKIYLQYLQAFKKGVFNYIKEEPDVLTKKNIPRKYFSGGVEAYRMNIQYKGEAEISKQNFAQIVALVEITGEMNLISDKAMNSTALEVSKKFKLNPYAFSSKFQANTANELEDHSIKRVEAAFERFVPDIWFEYQEYLEKPNSFSLSRLSLLKESLYRIKASHLNYWMVSIQNLSAFKGSHITAIVKTFPALHLNEYAFINNLTSDAARILSVRAKLERFKSDVWELFQKYIIQPSSFSDTELNELKTKFYTITQSDLRSWKLGAMFDRRQASIFEGSYIKVIQKSFSELNLKEDGFLPRVDKGAYNWNGGLQQGILIVRKVFSKEMPLLWEEYQRYVKNPNDFSSDKLRNLKEYFYTIDTNNFGTLGLRGALDLTSAPYFEGQLSKVMSLSFSELKLNERAFYYKFTGETLEIAEQNGVLSVRAGLDRFKPDLWKEYQNYIENKIQFNNDRLRMLKEHIYELTYSDLNFWGLSTVLKVPYFKGYADAFIKAFEGVKLNSFAFQPVYEGETPEKAEDNGIKSVQGALERFRPDIWEEYQRYILLKDQFTFEEVVGLKELIYQIEWSDFARWGLSSAINKNVLYFEGSYVVALLKSFPTLELNSYAFISHWSGSSSKEAESNGIKSVQAAIERYEPDFWKDYQRYTSHPEEFTAWKIQELRNKVYEFNSAHFQIWGIAKGTATDSAPYFGGYKIALQKSLPKLKLDLKQFKGNQTEPRFSWELGINQATDNVKKVIQQELPVLWNQYQKYVSSQSSFNIMQLAQLKEEFYRISHAHFLIWGLSKSFDRQKVPDFEGSHIKALALSFPDLKLNPYAASYVLNGETPEKAKENGIKSVQAAIERFKPELWQEYVSYAEHPEIFTIPRLRNLLEQIYQINDEDFRHWGLNVSSLKYFNNSFVQSLIESFHALNSDAAMNSKFDNSKLSWNSENESIKNIQKVIRINKPDIMERYENRQHLTSIELDKLRKDIYKIKSAHFGVWGLNVVLMKKHDNYFNGSYANALQKSFSELNLDLLGFGPDWSSEEKGIDTIHYALTRERPNIMEAYKRINSLSPVELQQLREEIYKITKAHFLIWGIQGALYKSKVPYFNGSHVVALQKSFPLLNLNSLGFGYEWTDEKKGLASVVYAIAQERPDIFEQYQKIKSLNLIEITKLHEHIYEITSGHFKLWGLSRALDKNNAPYFSGSHITILQKTFNDPLLRFNASEMRSFRKKNALARYVWDTLPNSINNVYEGIKINRPDIITKYERFDQLTPAEIVKLSNDIYKFTANHLNIWGLGAALTNKKQVPYFNRSYVVVFQKVFPKINLNPLAFVLDWSNEERGIASVKYRLSNEVPNIIERYDRLNSLNDVEKQILREDIYKITAGYFQIWGLGTVTGGVGLPYFEGSYIVALRKVFSKLELNPLGFRFDWSNEERSIASVLYAINQARPDIIERYKKLSSLGTKELNKLSQDILNITVNELKLWGLAYIFIDNRVPCFNKNRLKVFKKVFPGMNFTHLASNNLDNLNKSEIDLSNGGIDFNPSQMAFETKKEGQDFHFNLNGQTIDTAQVVGVEFKIKEMFPVTNLPLIFGLPENFVKKRN